MLETAITELTAAVIALTKTIETMNKPTIVNSTGLTSTVFPAPGSPPAAAPAPVQPEPAPVVIPVFTAPAAPAPAAPAPAAPAPAAPAPVAAPAAVMPPPPVFASAPAPAANALPFTDSNSLVAYVMGVYKQIGPQKGAGIQNVLTGLGVVNLTDVKPEMYAQFYAGVEALKA